MSALSESTSRIPSLFICGCGRSGTTFVYETIASHDGTAWIDRVSDRTVPLGLPAVPQRFKRLLRGTGRGRAASVVRPVEGYRCWDWVAPEYASAASRPLGATDVREAHRVGFGRIVEAVTSSRERLFVNKNTRNQRRIGWLEGVDPGAKYIHVVRHPYAVVRSLLRVPFWPSLPLWFADGRSPQQLVSAGEHREEVAARLWRYDVATGLTALAGIPAHRVMTVRYEDVVGHGFDWSQVSLFLELEGDRGFDRAARSRTPRPLVPPAEGWADDELLRIAAIVEVEASLLGYAL